jgi:hypothetical protein
MKDIMRFRKAAYLAARVSGDWNFALQQFCQEQKPFITAHLHRRYFGELAGFFQPYLKELTIEMMEEIYDIFYAEIYRRREEKAKFRPLTETEKRLHPLGKQAYEHFAKYVWEKRGKPFSAKASGGIKWGKPSRSHPAITQFLSGIGCEISTNLRGKKFLKISIAD